MQASPFEAAIWISEAGSPYLRGDLRGAVSEGEICCLLARTAAREGDSGDSVAGYGGGLRTPRQDCCTPQIRLSRERISMRIDLRVLSSFDFIVTTSTSDSE